MGNRPERGSGLDRYLGEIDRGPLLSARQEVELGRRVAKGCERSRRTLVEKNLRLVVSLAKRYRGLGVPFEDLLQEGNAGLLKAVEGFDPEKGFRFSTYATKWIKKALGQAVHDNSRTIRLPVHVGERLMRARREIGRRRAEGGPAMSLEEAARGTGLGETQARRLGSVPLDVLSLDEPVRRGGGDERGEHPRGSKIVDAGPTPEEAAIGAARMGALAAALEGLPWRERHVISRRYGLGEAAPATLRTIAEELGIGRERVRQLQIQGEERLARSPQVLAQAAEGVPAVPLRTAGGADAPRAARRRVATAVGAGGPLERI